MMTALVNTVNYLLPLLCVIFLLVGLIRHKTGWVLVALWVALVALLLQYQMAGGEFLGGYFNYQKAGIYAVNLLVLTAGIVYLFTILPAIANKLVKALVGLIGAALITGIVLLGINLGINAYFVEHRLPGTAVMQVVSFTPPEYCHYRYVFYRVDTDGKISYLCPNFYGLVPSMGKLDTAPMFLQNQFPQQNIYKHPKRKKRHHHKRSAQ